MNYFAFARGDCGVGLRFDCIRAGAFQEPLYSQRRPIDLPDLQSEAG